MSTPKLIRTVLLSKPKKYYPQIATLFLCVSPILSKVCGWGMCGTRNLHRLADRQGFLTGNKIQNPKNWYSNWWWRTWDGAANHCLWGIVWPHQWKRHLPLRRHPHIILPTLTRKFRIAILLGLLRKTGKWGTILSPTIRISILNFVIVNSIPVLKSTTK